MRSLLRVHLLFSIAAIAAFSSAARADAPGDSIFGANLDANATNFAFVADVIRTGMETYFELARKSRGDHYGPADLEAQDFMRRRWLEDQLFWDVLSKNFVPYEAWSAVNAPPVVKY